MKKTRNKTVLLIFMTSILAIILVSCGGVKVNRKVLVKDQEAYSFTTDSGTYTYRIALEPRTGPISGTTLGTTTSDSKLVLYKDAFPKDIPVTPGKAPQGMENKVQSFDIKEGAEYVKDDSVVEADGGKTPFEVMIDITADTEGSGAEKITFYLVDFKVKKQT